MHLYVEEGEVMNLCCHDKQLFLLLCLPGRYNISTCSVTVEVKYRCHHGKQLFLLLYLPAAGSYISICSVRVHTYRLTGIDVTNLKRM